MYHFLRVNTCLIIAVLIYLSFSEFCISKHINEYFSEINERTSLQSWLSSLASLCIFTVLTLGAKSLLIV